MREDLCLTKQKNFTFRNEKRHIEKNNIYSHDRKTENNEIMPICHLKNHVNPEIK